MLVLVTNRIARHCAECGAVFSPTSSQLKAGNGKFCSLKCLGISRRILPGVSAKQRDVLVDRVCESCGGAFRVRTHAAKQGKGRLCRHCITVSAGKRARELHPWTGENNHRWKGGITSDYRAWLRAWTKQYRLKNPNQQKARDAVRLALRNGTLVKGPCRLCGSTESIQGHHHNGYDEPHWLDVRWLCRTCHCKTHGKLGGFTQG